MEPPSFPAGSPQTVRAAPGSDVHLQLPLPDGTPPFHFQWSRAGASLDGRFAASEGAGGVRLTVSSARTGDSGVYTLQASNAAGSDTRRLRLEVSAEEAPSGEDPPAFLRRLQDLTVKVGTRTRFLVEIISSTECKVTWYRNERRLMEAERVALVRDGNLWCADVATVSVEDAGRWTCTAENLAGRASCSAHLNVLVPKAYKRPEFVEELRALLTEQGTVSLECKVVGVPTPVLRWFKDSREIKAGDVFALTANAEDPTSLGTYTCEAVNCMGRAYSSSKVHVIGRGTKDGPLRPNSGGVTPEPPPIFTKELEDQFIKICDHLTLSCHIVVPPWPRSVVWYNKEGKIEPSERYHVIEDGVGGYLVEVGSAEWADEGEWKCVATSSGGRVGITTCHVAMDVPKNFRKPRFMENLQAVLTEEGLVSFECKVVGFPTPVLSWFKDGQELKPGDVYQLTGTNSLGSYCCIARNCMGQASSSAELTVEDIQNQLNEEEKLQLFSKNQAPKFIQGLKSVEAKIDEPFRFTIKVAIPPEPSVLWYRDDQPIDESPRCRLGKEEKGNFFLDIQNLEFLDQAEWKCVAMNDFGHSVTSCFLKLLIPRHYKKPRFLENLQALLSDEGAVNLECKVIGVPQPVLKWYKDGEELKPGDIHRIISGQDGTCCLGTYTCEAQNCMGIAASSASLLGFDDSVKTKSKKKPDEQSLQRNLSLSTIHEERTSQMYDTPMGDITLDDKGEISFSFDGKEVSVSLYETPDLTEEEALQIVEMYADQLSENITEHNVVELPPLRFVKETSTSGNLLMEAIIIDVSPEYFTSPEEDLRTEADIEDISIADENVPSQLSLDQDISLEEKIIPTISDEKSNAHLNLKRKKSDSQKSGDDYFSLSRDHSISEGKRDDDTQPISESDLQSFASAHSSSKPSKSPKISEFEHEVFEAKTHLDDNKVERGRKLSHSSRKSSSESEKLKEELQEQIDNIDKTRFEMKFKEYVINIGSSLNNIMNDVQNLEKDIILKSELMSSAATASKSLEIINSLLTPLSEVYSINDAILESIIENNDVSETLFVKLSQSLKSLQQSLTIVEKCIDVGNDNRTLVKKTCISLIELCGEKLQALMSNVKYATINSSVSIRDDVVFDIESITNEVNTIITFTGDTIKAKNLLNEASELQSDELSSEAKYLRDTQKCIFNLKRPLISLLSIVENAERGKITDVVKVNSSRVILSDMSASIQDLQSALEQIELLSVSETSTSVNKYNTEIINVVMNPIIQLRTSFESLSTDTVTEENSTVLKQKIIPVKNNLNVIFSYLNDIEKTVGTFDILQSDNKLEALQIIAQILISLENNLPRLDVLPDVKNHMNLFHKQLTKALENVIESNETKKYFDLIEICDAVKRINNSIHDVDSQNELCLASINNTLQVIDDCLQKNVFDIELNRSIITNISDLMLCIQESLNTADDKSLNFETEYTNEMPEFIREDNKVNVVIECIDRTLATIASVTTLQSSQELGKLGLPPMENILPVLEELKCKIAFSGLSGIENEEHVSEITEMSSLEANSLAKPLYELSQYVSVLNEMLVENPESIKEFNQEISTFAEPLNELYKTLEILQHDVISQLGGELTPYGVSLNIANAVQNLRSAILIVNENIGLEVNDELSTLDDISGLKTTAETVRSETLAMPCVVQTNLQTFLQLTEDEKHVSGIEEALLKLNEHVMALQNPEYKKELLNVLNIGSITSSSSAEEHFDDICAEIEEILHSIDMSNGENINKLVALVKPMLVLQQSLSVVDTNNIPVFEHSLDFSSDSIHSVFQNISELKNHLEKCVQVIETASEISDNTIEISQSIEALQRSCKFLGNSLKSCNTMSMAKKSPLNVIIKMLLDATDTSKGLNVKNVKVLSKELHDEMLTICDDVLSLTPQPVEEMEQEANLLEALREIESAIVVLEQNHFDNISEPTNVKSYYTQIATVIETEQFNHFEDVLKSTINAINDYMEYSDNIVHKNIENFLKQCENKLKILNYLINKPLTFKSVIRLYQEYSTFYTSVGEFDYNMPKLDISIEIKECLKEYLDKSKKFLEIAQMSLIRIFETQGDMVFTVPFEILKQNSEILSDMIEKCGSSEIKDLTTKFLNITGSIIPNNANLKEEVISTLTCNAYTDKNYIVDDNIKTWNIFVNAVQEMLSNNSLNSENKQKIEEILNCLQMFCNIQDANDSTKKILLLKCMSECSEILKELIVNNQKEQDLVKNAKTILESTLKTMLEPLKDLNKQLIDIKEKQIKDDVPLQIASMESDVKTAFEGHEDVLHCMEIDNLELTVEDKEIVLNIYNEIQSIKNNLCSLSNAEELLLQSSSLNSIENFEQSILKILSPEKLHEGNHVLEEKTKKLRVDLQKYKDNVEVFAKISLMVPIEEVAESISLANELCGQLSSDNAIDTRTEVQLLKEISDPTEQIRKFKNAIQILYNELLEHHDDIEITLGKDNLQIAIKIMEDLREDLLAVTMIQTLDTAANHVYIDRIANENIETGTITLVQNIDDDLKKMSRVTVMEENDDQSYIREIPEKHVGVLNSDQSAIEIDTDFRLTNEIIKGNDVSVATGESIKVVAKEVTTAKEDTLVDVDSQCSDITKKEIVYDTLIKHIEELMSPDCAEVIAKLCLISKEPNDTIIKVAEEVKTNITSAMSQPENELFDVVEVEKTILNNANLLLELQHAVSTIQTVIREESRELPPDFMTIDLQYAKTVLTNLSLDLNELISIGPEAKHSIAEKQTNLLNTLVQVSSQVCTSDNVIEENISSIVETEMYTKQDEPLVTIEETRTKENKCEDICTENIKKEEISSSKTETEIVHFENNIINENVDLTSHVENNLKGTDEVAEDIKDSLQFSCEIVQQEDSMQRLKSLLQEVSDKIDTLTTVRTVDDRESLQNNLDEIQAVIIEIKRDYDGSGNDTLNESLEDLECSVRSVQLQIHENSPLELLKEACATLQLLVTNMTATQNVQVVQTASYQAKLENILQSCSDDTQDTLNLLDVALNTSTDDENELNVLLASLDELKVIIKSLKSDFDENIEVLIERGVEIMQNLDQTEDRVFTLEKDVNLNNKIKPIQRDHLVTAIHSIYGTISNMRSAMTSVQKQYMFENYGKSSELVLIALKNLSFITQSSGKHWKALSKSLRKVLNHFEDIKFYINFDKTARLPSDSTFTKIILLDLKSVLSELLLTEKEKFSPAILSQTETIIKCLEDNLLKIENQTSLEVKDKIPIFKSFALNISNLTKSIKEFLEFTESREITVSEIKEGSFSGEERIINATEESPNEAESMSRGTTSYDTIEQTSRDVVQLNAQNNSLKDAIELPTLGINANNDESNNKPPNHNDKDSNLSAFNLQPSDGKTGIIIETYVSNFAIEVFPETMFTENVSESLFLQLEELKPLEATSSQAIETRVFYKAKITETVTEIFIEDYLKLEQSNQDSLKEENSLPDSNKMQERVSVIREDDSHKKAEETSACIEDSTKREQKQKDIKIEQKQEIRFQTQEENNGKTELSLLEESLGSGIDIEKAEKCKEIDKSLEKYSENEKDSSILKCVTEDLEIEKTDIKSDSPVKHISNIEENNIMEESVSTAICDKKIDDNVNTEATINIEQSSVICSETSEDVNLTPDSLVIGDFEHQDALVLVDSSSENNLEPENENIRENQHIDKKVSRSDDIIENIKKDVEIETNTPIKYEIEDNNNNNSQIDSTEKCIQEISNVIKQSQIDFKMEQSNQDKAEIEEKDTSKEAATPLECHDKGTNLEVREHEKQHSQDIEAKNEGIILMDDNNTEKTLNESRIKIDDVSQDVKIHSNSVNEEPGVTLNMDANVSVNSMKVLSEVKQENILDDNKCNIITPITDIKSIEVVNGSHGLKEDIYNSDQIANNEISIISDVKCLQVPSNTEIIDTTECEDQSQRLEVSKTISEHDNKSSELICNQLISTTHDLVENYAPDPCENCENLTDLAIPNEKYQHAYEVETNEKLNEIENIIFPNLELHILKNDIVDENINMIDTENALLDKKDNPLLREELQDQSNSYQYHIMHPKFIKEDIIEEETEDFTMDINKLLEGTDVTVHENDGGREKAVSVSHKLIEDVKCATAKIDTCEVITIISSETIESNLNKNLEHEDIDPIKAAYTKNINQKLSDTKEDSTNDQRMKIEDKTKLEEDLKKVEQREEKSLGKTKLKKKKAEKNKNKSFENGHDAIEPKTISDEKNKLTKVVDIKIDDQGAKSQRIISDGNMEFSHHSVSINDDKKMGETELNEDFCLVSDKKWKQGESEAVEQSSETIKASLDNESAIPEVEKNKINKAEVQKDSLIDNIQKNEQKSVEDGQCFEKPDNKREEIISYDETIEVNTREGTHTDVNTITATTKEQVMIETKELDQDSDIYIKSTHEHAQENVSETEKFYNESISKKELKGRNKDALQMREELGIQKDNDYDLNENEMKTKTEIPVCINNRNESEPMDTESIKELEIENDENCTVSIKRSESFEKQMLSDVDIHIDNHHKHKSRDTGINIIENKNGISPAEKSSPESQKVIKLELSNSNDLRDKLIESSQGVINVSEIRQVELNAFNNKLYNNIPDKDVSNVYVDEKLGSKRMFIDQTRIDYENDFLKPPGYMEKKLSSDYPTPQLEKGQSSTFYKAHTLVSNVPIKSISASSSSNTNNNEILELNADVTTKPKVILDGRKTLPEKRSSISRDVKRKPVFSTHLTDRTAVEGSRVKLTCSVLTSLEPKVTWYKNGAPLDDKHKYRTKFLDGLLTMEVLNAVPSDSAEYSCTVDTGNGSVSTTANLKVYPSFETSPIPPTFTRSIRDNYHLAEDELVLECRIRGQPLPTIRWFKDDKLLESSDRHQAFYLADGVCRLCISKPTPEDSGKYTCKAENSMWSDEISHIVSFTGKEAGIGPNLPALEKYRLNRHALEFRRPHFANVLTDYKVASGGTIGLQVEIKGAPIRVEWLREGRSITEIYRNAQTFVDHGLYTLALSDVTETESGIYTCRAWSNHGNVDMNAAITVVKPNEINGKPAVIIGRPQKDMLISVGEDLNISFRVQGEPKPKVTLMKGIRDISNSQRVFKMTSDDYAKFTLKRSVVSDAGTYCILARNAYGCDRAFVTVVIRQRASSENLISDWTYPMDDPTIVIDERRFKSVPNRIPGEPSVVDGGNNWLSLAWPKPDSGSGAPVQAYKVESWLLGKDGGARWVELGITPLNSFDVFNLKKGEEYHFRVTPRNRHGWGESVQTSTPIGVGRTGDRPEFINILPGQLKVLVGETAVLKCSFKGRPIPEIVWMKNGLDIDEEDKHLNTYLGSYESSLTINGVRVEDEARYSCEATNIHGRASTYARVAVVTDRLIWEADAKLKRERSADVGGDCPPQFTMRLRDRRVQATYPVRLTCQVIGRPPPLITWFKDGEEVEYDNRRTKSQDELFHTLEIAPTYLEDGGTYEAMARNSSGAISCRCNLVVDKGIRAYVAPEFCCGLEPLYQLSVGEELRMSAVVEAYPSVGVTWYRDGIRLRPSRRAVMTLDRDGQIELAVASVAQRDAGVYTCTASNEVGTASTSAKVQVLGDSAGAGDRPQTMPTLVCPDVPYSKEPAFIRKPRSSEAREGDTVIIECEVIGDPKPEVYWLRDFLRPDYYRDASHFKRVGAGPEYRIEIPHAKLDYTGAYSVIAKNQYGEAKAVISLQILAKDPSSTEEAHNVRYGRVEVIPRFEKELTDLLSHDGDAVEFECRVSGNPEPDIKWYHYTECIRDCPYFETTYELGTARLKIRQVTADDEGTYTCEARNNLGKAITSACLIVYPPGEPNTLSQRLRRPPALLSSASTPRSTPARSMSRTRTPVPDMRRLCSPAREIAPKFYTYPFNKVAEEGDTVVFQCAVKGLPAPWATWDKDGVVITPSSRIAVKEKDEMLRTLEIDEVTSDDVGLYRITLENDYGRAEASARLEVISHTGKFFSGGRSYSASPRRSLSYKRSKLSLPRQD